VDFKRSVKYGLGVVRAAAKYALARKHLLNTSIFSPQGRKLVNDSAGSLPVTM
jgi:hypothetical protein